MNATIYSEYTHPGKWIDLYTDLPDDLEHLIAVVKNLLIHPVDVHRHGIRVTSQRDRALRQLFTVERMLDDLFQTPPVSLVAARSPYRRLVEWCDYHTILFASFCRFKGYEARTRCGFANYIDRERWMINHWLNEVRRPIYDDWTLVDADRQCFPAREDFRTGAEWWPMKNTAGTSKLTAFGHRGVDAVKHLLLNDFNALNGHEFVHHRWLNPDTPDCGPAIYHTAYARLGARQRVQLEKIAAAIRIGNEAEIATLFNDNAYRGRFISSEAAQEGKMPSLSDSPTQGKGT